MEMYRIMFSGEVLDGFQKQDVQQAAAIRFKISDEKLAQLFSGRPAVLKKAMTAEASQPYLAELARMGMKAIVEPIAQIDQQASNDLRFKVVFWGKTLPGFARDAVIKAIPARLRMPENQVMRLFSGGKAVLKRGITAEVGARYVAELARIGMQVELEIEVESLPPAVPSAGAAATTQTGGAADYSLTSFMQTQINFEQTGSLLNNNVMRESYGEDAPPMPTTPSAPSISKSPLSNPKSESERLSSMIEAAYAAELGEENKRTMLRCPQCEHRQSTGSHCNACGCALPKTRATIGPIRQSVPAEPTVVVGASMQSELRNQNQEAAFAGGSQATQFDRILQSKVLIPLVVAVLVLGWVIFGK